MMIRDFEERRFIKFHQCFESFIGDFEWSIHDQQLNKQDHLLIQLMLCAGITYPDPELQGYEDIDTILCLFRENVPSPI